MFADAVAKTTQFTRPVLSISRTYRSADVVPGLATLFFVNDRGCAVTCRHVADQIIKADNTNKSYRAFSKRVRSVMEEHPHDFRDEIAQLEKQYGYEKGVTVSTKYNFVGTPSPLAQFTIHMHPTYDLAIIEFKGYNDLHYNASNIFLLGDDREVRQGKSLCRLGFPFPEFTNYQYNSSTDDIEWTSAPPQVPCFPMDGIVTRHLAGRGGEIFGIEMSTPGLRGQSGGPLFDTDGRIFGMQSSTKHLYLGFDIENDSMFINGEKKSVSNQPFLHVGQCIHVRIIREFLDQHNIPYRTA